MLRTLGEICGLDRGKVNALWHARCVSPCPLTIDCAVAAQWMQEFISFLENPCRSRRDVQSVEGHNEPP